MALFQLVGLNADTFAHLADLDEQALAAQGVRSLRAPTASAYPCRVSLQDADVGDALWLLSYEHLAVDSPYRAAGPIYVRVGARTAELAPGEVPPYITRRLISLRAYDSAHLMVAAEVCEGDAVSARLDRLFARAEVEYVQLHNARPGCFACEARRVPG